MAESHDLRLSLLYWFIYEDNLFVAKVILAKVI